MPIRDCLLLIGHAGARYDEAGHLRGVARRALGLPLVMVNDALRSEDERHFECCYAADFTPARLAETVPAFAAQIDARYRPVGVLPFRDSAVPFAAAVAQRYGLPGPEPQRARAGIDKGFFRALESAATAPPAGYHRVRATEVESYERFMELFEASGRRLFIKPRSESNSRGCIALSECSESEARAAWEELQAYRAGGILTEELVSGADEYSWDYAGGATWLTEKRTSSGKYRAEVQQIVPAPAGAAEAVLNRTGLFSRHLVSLSHGAYHNELFYIPASGKAAIVEVNMRPGGMFIWDLARNAFAGFDPWEAWARWAVSGQPYAKPLRRRAYSGVRYLRARRDGTLREVPNMAGAARAAGVAILSGAYQKPLGRAVSAQLTDNVGTYGYVVCEAADHAALCEQLRVAAEAIEGATVIA